MSSYKKTVRNEFRKAVFERDSYKCRCCGKQGYDHNDPQEVAKIGENPMGFAPLDAHHIAPRDEMPAGGYVKENGITLCPECHFKAESQHATCPEFSPENLYTLIGSSKNNARFASLALEKKLEKFKIE